MKQFVLDLIGGICVFVLPLVALVVSYGFGG